MKQLKKLRLNDFTEMTDNEMKFVIGGYAGGIEPACHCSGMGCTGSCPDRYEESNTGYYYTLIPQTCKGVTVYNSDYSVGTEICMCV